MLAAPHSRDADGDSPIMFMLYLNLLERVRRTSECRVRSCLIGLPDGVWTSSLNRQCVVPRLVFQVPSTCWSSHERHWLVAWLALRKGGGFVVAFVLVHLLSRCHVVCDGRLLQHGGIGQDIVCFCGCQEAYLADNW